MSFKPFLVLDLETTGLDVNRAGILQVAAALVDLDEEKYIIETFNEYLTFSVNYSPFEDGAFNVDSPPFEDGAFKMHLMSGLLKKCIEQGKPFTDVRAQFGEFVERCYARVGGQLRLTKDRLTVAGYNVGQFDKAILEIHNFPTQRLSHQCLEVSSLYMPKFGYVPSSAEINKHLGLGEVKHDAMEDVIDTIAAIRAALPKELPRMDREEQSLTPIVAT